MRSVFLRIFAAALTVAVLVPTSAQAIVKTINFTATDLGPSGDNFYGILGIPRQETITGSFTYDTSRPPIDEFTNLVGTESKYTPYDSFSFNIGSILVSAGTSPYVAPGHGLINDNRIEVNNATAVDRGDSFRIRSSWGLGVSGGTGILENILVEAQISVGAFRNPNVITDTSIPSLAILNTLPDFQSIFQIYYDGPNNQTLAAQYDSVIFTEGTSVVPVPAALPLFGTGLAIMGFIGWRRKRKLAA